VVAFDLGAVAERLKSGRLVPLEEGADGIVRALPGAAILLKSDAS
jgi:hypothetical protein